MVLFTACATQTTMPAPYPTTAYWPTPAPWFTPTPLYGGERSAVIPPTATPMGLGGAVPPGTPSMDGHDNVPTVADPSAPVIAVSTATPREVVTPEPEKADPGTGVPAGVSTPTPTGTPMPGVTPSATATSSPIATPTSPGTSPVATPTGNSLSFKGLGSSSVEMAKWDGPALARISCTCDQIFSVATYNAQGVPVDVLVDTMGNYVGTVPIDFESGKHSTRLQITASGTWEIAILPMTEVQTVKLPGSYQGEGDMVVALMGGTPDSVTVDASGAKGRFTLWTFSVNMDLKFNETAPYQGTKLIDPASRYLIIRTAGPWKVDLTTGNRPPDSAN